MPINAGDPQHWTRLTPTTGDWRSVPFTGPPEDFVVDTDHFYVNVQRQLPAAQ